MKTSKKPPPKKSPGKRWRKSTKRTIDFDVPAPDDFGPRRRHIDREAVDEELQAAVQAKLVALATKPVTPRSLFELEQMTRVTRELIAIGQDPRALPRKHHGHPIQSYGGSSFVGGQDVDSTGYVGGSEFGQPFFQQGGVVGTSLTPGPLASSPPAENWGATVVRELMSLLGAKKPDVKSDTDVVLDAIANARMKGLHDVADMLTKNLINTPEMNPPGSPGLPIPLPIPLPAPDLPPLPKSLKKTKPSGTAKTVNGASS